MAELRFNPRAQSYARDRYEKYLLNVQSTQPGPDNPQVDDRYSLHLINFMNQPYLVLMTPMSSLYGLPFTCIWSLLTKLESLFHSDITPSHAPSLVPLSRFTG